MAIRKKRWFFIYVPVLLLTVFLLLLFTVGIPLTFLVGMADGGLKSMNWTLSVRRVLLKGDFGGGLTLYVDGTRIGDATQTDAVELDGLSVGWRIGQLLRLRPLPAEICVCDLVLRPRMDDNATLVFLTMPPKVGDEAPAPPADIALPDYLLPGDGKGIRLRVKGFRVMMPPMAGAAASEYALDLDGSLVREGRNLGTDFEILLSLNGERLSSDVISGNVSLDDMAVGLDLRASANLDLLSAQFAAGDSARASGDLVLDVRLDTNLNHPEGSAAKIGLTSEGLTLSGSPLPAPVRTGPIDVRTGIIARRDSAGLSGVGVKFGADFGEGGFSATADADFDPRTLTISYELAYELKDYQPVADLADAFGVKDLALRLKGRAAGLFDADAKALRDIEMGLSLSPLELQMNGARFMIPACDLELSGGVGNIGSAVPDADILCMLILDAGAVKPWTNRVDLHVRELGGDTRIKIESTGFSLDQLAAFMPPELNLKAAGALDFNMDARLNLPARELAGLNVELIAADMLVINAPAFLKNYLVVDPFVFKAASDLGSGLLCSVEPFRIKAGPLVVSSSGVKVRRGADGEASGTLPIEVGPLELSEILDILSDDILSRLPLPREELAQMGIKSLKASFSVRDDGKGGTSADVVADGSLHLNEGALGFVTKAHVDVGAKTWAVSLQLPDFVQSTWKLAMLRRLSVPDIDAPVRVSIDANGDFEGRISGAQWLVEAGPGYLRPSAPLGMWAGGAFPLDRFAVGGSIGKELRSLSMDLLELRSGRASMKFRRARLDSDLPLTAMGGAKVSATVSFEMTDWFLEDFIPILGADALSGQGISAADMSLLGLESFDFEADLIMSADASGAVSVADMRGRNQAVFRVGQERIPVDVDITTQDGSRIRALARIEGIRPDRIAISMLRNLPFPIQNIQIPFGVELAVSAGLPGVSPLDPSVHAVVQAGPGRIAACDLLAEDLPLRSLRVELDARPDLLKVENFSLNADFNGPVFSISRAEILLPSEGRTGSTTLDLGMRDWELAWLWRKVPPAMLPAQLLELLKGMELEGALRSLDLHARLDIDPENPTPSCVRECSLKVDAGGFRVRVPGYPDLHMNSFSVLGDEKLMGLLVEDAGLDGAGVDSLRIDVSEPFLDARSAAATLAASCDLGALKSVVAGWAAHPAALDSDLVRSMHGILRFSANATAPLRAGIGPADARAGF
ncbi:MAG: hypothetical protein WC360_02455, partial [Opitutales bacterium]